MAKTAMMEPTTMMMAPMIDDDDEADDDDEEDNDDDEADGAVVVDGPVQWDNSATMADDSDNNTNDDNKDVIEEPDSWDMLNGMLSLLLVSWPELVETVAFGGLFTLDFAVNTWDLCLW